MLGGSALRGHSPAHVAPDHPWGILSGPGWSLLPEAQVTELDLCLNHGPT